MSEILEKLTEEQEAAIPAHVEKYIELGLSTKPFDEDLSRYDKLMADVYKNADLPPPKHYLYVRSPNEAVKAFKFLMVTSLSTEIETIEPYLSKGRLVGDWQKETQKLFSTLTAEQQQSVKQAISDTVNQFCYGSHDAGWTAFYDFFKTVCKLDGLEKIEPLKALVGEVGWFLPCEEVVIVAQNPSKIHLKDKKLHNEEGPAVEYEDGFSIFCVNGEVKDSLMEIMLAGMRSTPETAE